MIYRTLLALTVFTVQLHSAQVGQAASTRTVFADEAEVVAHVHPAVMLLGLPARSVVVQ